MEGPNCHHTQSKDLVQRNTEIQDWTKGNFPK